MGLKQKLMALKRIYALYDQYTEDLEVACQKYCAYCCTCNVSITSLEAANIHQALTEKERAEIRRRLRLQLAKQRYIPKITLNRMAELCANREDPPEETIDPDWGACPLLDNMTCPIYEVRPFGCRCLLSTQNCGVTGYAVIDEYTVTVNYVFSQFIEHLDQNGATGNLADILLATPTESEADTPALNSLLSGYHWVDNRPIPILLIPPAHLEKISPLINELHSIISTA